MECSICLCAVEKEDASSTTDCGHVFHSKCIFKSIGYKNFSCPNCREQLIDIPPNNKQEDTDDLIRSIIAIRGLPAIINSRTILNESSDIHSPDNTNISIFHRNQRLSTFPPSPLRVQPPRNDSSDSNPTISRMITSPISNSTVLSFLGLENTDED